MNISSVSINRPVLAMVMSILIIIFGVIGFNYLGVREFPSIDPPIISVRTSYAGANADVIKSQITEPLEKAINGIAGIRNISSTSAQGISNITVEFNLDADLEAAANDVRDKVSQALRQLPQDIDAPPVVSKADANSDAIISMTIQSDTKNQLQVSDFAENVVAERLQTIPGVSSVQIWGQKKYAMRIWMDPARLAAFRLTPLDVLNALNKENVELPAGKLAGNKTELIVNTYGKLKDPEEFNNLIIGNSGTQLIKLSDIGYATLGPENEETILKESGVPMVAVALVPQPGSNYLDIAKEFYKRLDLIKRDLSSDYKLNIAMDNTRFVQQSVSEVKETIFIAITLVILIIYLFFRDWIIAFRPLIDIPVSLIGAFFIMYLTGFSINVLTLLAIVLATGLVVDDGIVVTENIYKKVEAGMDPTQAAHEGSKEIFFAIVSTSITLAAVFLPIIFLQGFVGRLFREFGVVLAGAVLISAFVSLTLTPMLNAKMLRKGQKHSKFYQRTEPFFEWLNNSYRNLLARFMKKRYLAFVIILISGVLIFVVGKNLQSELAPLDDRSFLRMSIIAPEGVSYEYTDDYINKLAEFIDDSIPEKKVLLTVTAPSFSGSGAVNTGFARLTLTDPDQRQRSQQMIADYLSSKVRNFQQAKTFVLQQQTISAGGGGASSSFPVQYVLKTQDFDKLREAVPKFMDEAQKSKVFQGVDVNLKFNKPELDVEIDREKAKSLGLSVQDIAQTMQLAFSGQRFSYFEMFGNQYQVIAQFDRANRDEPLDLKSLFVRNNNGELIQLDNVVTVVEKSSPPQLYNFNRYESATISAGLAPGKTVGDGVDEMNRIAAKVLDDSFTTDLSGASRDYAESGSNISFAFGLALILIYLILAAQFESFIDPLIIMITVPLALAGAVLSLWIFGQTLNIFSEIGIIMLIGLVTKNGILIVEFANQKREQGEDLMHATIDAAVSRFRPILMTSLATMLGALPIALAIGAGAKSRVSMGIVVIGGLLFSLVLTLFVIPAMYSFMSRKRKIAHD
ncbi:MAG: Efflux pump membrane transporter BepE [Bacteroidetes bacterium ADurb.Bin141]|nr:MAG: cation/multidrug efflux pump [Bacteroidetes bacterium OLB10]MBE7509516.1 efflux RND transporter permease subunit [Bacteroidia bacterium]MBX3105467.1 efflux RND transporter permease subunit [Bacteroidota bacterium]MCE7955245.1 efflux RND transporter permease subunit [Bacteroidetes bacterium CHB6]OQB65212.1 MAG: Efflux pump membrane transporter BepE [Bacteroidetes bacterium ADurb.Bin141]